MKIKKQEIKELISNLGFLPEDGLDECYYKNYQNNENYVIKIDFKNKKIKYGEKITCGDLTTSNFENSENFVVLECVNRLLKKGYPPERIHLEYKWPMGRNEKGKLDILVSDDFGKSFLMIECKTWGEEYEKEKKKMLKDGGQLFSYFQQDKSAKYLCLYTSRNNQKLEYKNEVIKVEEQWRELDTAKEVVGHWNKNFKDNGIFENWANAYDVEIKALTRSNLKELTEEDGGRIFNQFAEILRHNVVSDKPNAFNKIFNLFLCKIVDEDRLPDEELAFQWKDDDDDKKLQMRLNDLYKKGMLEYMSKEVTDYSDKQIEDILISVSDQAEKQKIIDMFTNLRLQKNNEFAFKEVFDEKSFKENAVVVKEVVELLQPYQLRYGHKQQFLGDFFELLLTTGLKQETGQFFTPVPIAKFIISCMPLKEKILENINDKKNDFLPYVIDYAAGSGHFLTETMDEIQSIIETIDTSKQRPGVKSSLERWKLDPFSWAYEYIYGIEADYRLVKTAKISCFLNGDGLANVIHADGLDNFEKSTDYKLKLKSCKDSKNNEEFDVLVTNPPYSVSAFKNTLKNGEDSFELFNRLTDNSSEIECLFIERAKQLLKEGGFAGIILPSSILSNSGIYTNAREIILKYFKIKGISEFGSNTFMATNTNTITLFLEKRNNSEWKRIEKHVSDFFKNPKETTVSGIEKAFSKYVEHVFENLSLDDYIAFLKGNTNENIENNELLKEYKLYFDKLSEINNLKKKKVFKDLSKEEQTQVLNEKFIERFIELEKEKMLYFFLAYPQKTIIVKTGDKQDAKDFLGYEFSSRRGNEGIKLYKDENGKFLTKLYDEENILNHKKANSYIYNSFKGEDISEIDKELEENVYSINLLDLIEFSTIDFYKSIDISAKKKTKIDTKWPLIPLKEITRSFTGVVFDKSDESIKETDSKVLTASNIDLKSNSLVFDKIKYLKDTYWLNNDEKLTKGDILVCTSSGSIGHLGKFAFVEEDIPCWAGGFCGVLRNEDYLMQKYISIILSNYPEYRNYIEKYSGQNINNLKMNELLKFKIPVPDGEILNQIISDFEKIKDRENKVNLEINSLKKSSYENFKIPIGDKDSKLKKIAELISGQSPNSKYYNRQGTGLPFYQGKKEFGENYLNNPVVWTNQITSTSVNNDILMSVRAPVGDVNINNIGNICIGRGLAAIRTFGMDFKVLYYYLKYNSEMIVGKKGVGFDSISRDRILNIKIPKELITENDGLNKEIERIEKDIMIREDLLEKISDEKMILLKKYLE
ncbi:type I restriction enzyme M protein [Methanococcus maripaludis]|uniref:Type I restriction enzyme M protein n=1 Tax=Methanococcus maripaludis TaxID=39152 RepID=A0A7J9NIY8_METMI|nr:N-6 DNA methylase [Methanococcus maripaludis]MBA2840885.1 type I restriction enzyme M protein [Methanococcus maripaludis]